MHKYHEVGILVVYSSQILLFCIVAQSFVSFVKKSLVSLNYCSISMPIESFLFFFKGNQERANEQLGKIEGICCLKNYIA